MVAGPHFETSTIGRLFLISYLCKESSLKTIFFIQQIINMAKRFPIKKCRKFKLGRRRRSYLPPPWLGAEWGVHPNTQESKPSHLTSSLLFSVSDVKTFIWRQVLVTNFYITSKLLSDVNTSTSTSNKVYVEALTQSRVVGEVGPPPIDSGLMSWIEGNPAHFSPSKGRNETEMELIKKNIFVFKIYF